MRHFTGAKSLRAIAIVFVFVCIPLVSKAQYDLDQFFYKGRELLIDGKYSAAIDNFNVLASLDSTSYEAYFFRGIAKYNLGDFPGA